MSENDVRIAVNFVRSLAKSIQFSQVDIQKLMVTVSELTQNVVDHANGEGFIILETMNKHGVKITVKDWIDYLQSLSNGETQVDYPKQMNDFIYLSCNKYYSEHIEDFNPEALAQVKEFNEANMLFYIMDKHVWSKASQRHTR